MGIVFKVKAFFSTLRPGRLLIVLYVSAILTASILLYLPVFASGERLSFIDACFTATSALCVTGLIVVDTGSAFNTAGQVLILILFQVGGLGIMTLSTFFFQLIGRRVSSRDRQLLYDTYTPGHKGEIRQLLAAVVKYSLVIELAGAVILTLNWMGDYGFVKAFYSAAFHAVSAFANAGFSLYPDSMIRYQHDLVTNLVFYGLIFLGGIGFVIILRIENMALKRGLRRKPGLHSKIVITVSAVLILSGATMFLLLEYNNVLDGMSILQKLEIAFFQSMTARTAGFNTVDMTQLSNATLLMMMFLMFVGASPGSCGGGIKTTTLGVLIALMYNRIRGGERVNIASRTLPSDIVNRAVSVFMVGVFVVFSFTAILMVTQFAEISFLDSRGMFVEYVFETVSAFGTVGLSMGVTESLSGFGKFLIIILMLVGRIGPLSVAYALARRPGRIKLEFAEENVMIG
ncbi:MAG: hypothetical protein GF315_14190 [candidate division Zixibacteria bacterium]|nr:hypothetical protein [candidate division Zixibacteria bacterium]